ncbi:MAG: hypothetical protein M1831_004480 [Alyxoria varia]|nr:MAG: hypothetical protein M1831_004480 [Alyxoria varia]
MHTKEPTGNVSLPGIKRKYQPRNEAERHENRRIGLISGLPDPIRKHIVALLGEFVGTFLFLFFAFAGTQVANTPTNILIRETGPNVPVVLYISLAFGFSLLVNVWVFYRITGGVFNPAVTLGLCMIEALPWIRGAVIFVAQILGGIAAAGVVAALFPGDMLVATALSNRTSVTRGLFIEMFLTFELVFTIFMLAAEKNRATFLAPVGIGLALFITHLAGVYFTGEFAEGWNKGLTAVERKTDILDFIFQGASLNPARSFGPCVVNASFPGHHWIYWIGPLFGTLLAVLFYKLVKGLEYETVNPGQDEDHEPRNFKNDEEPKTQPTLPTRRYDGASSEKKSDRGSEDENV